MLLVSGWFSVSKTIIPEAGSTFSSFHHDATLISSVDWGLRDGAAQAQKNLIGPTVSDCPRACPTPARLAPACLLLQSGCRPRPPPALRAVRNRLRGADTLSTRPNPSGSKTCRLYPLLFMPRLTSLTTSPRWMRVKPRASIAEKMPGRGALFQYSPQSLACSSTFASSPRRHRRSNTQLTQLPRH